MGLDAEHTSTRSIYEATARYPAAFNERSHGFLLPVALAETREDPRAG
jgi:hypothetical protein